LGGGCGSYPSGYSSGQWSGEYFEFHRVFIDQANDVAYLFSAVGSPGNSAGNMVANQVANLVVYTASGKPNEISACTSTSCSQNIALSFGFVDQNNGAGGSFGETTNTINTTDYNGCVGVNSLDVTTDESITTCGVVGTAASVAATAVDAIRMHYATDAITTIVTDSTPNTGVAFTSGANIYTATF
jgi:hypothetical protein